jgi:hypothetical protein
MKNIIKKITNKKLTNTKGIVTYLIDGYYEYFLLPPTNKRDTIIKRIQEEFDGEYRPQD